MSVPPVEVRATYDGTELSTGALQSAQDIERLADSVDASADAMRASLASIDDGVSTTLSTGGTFSSGVDDVEAEGGRLKEVGSEVGAEFAANLGEGVSSGDLKGTLVDTFAGLGAAAGATGQIGLIAAGTGLLLGATIMKGLTQGAEEKRQEFIAAVTSAFQSIEVNARQSMQQIRKELLDTYDTKALLVEVTENEIATTDELRALAAQLKVPFSELVEVLRGDINPANRDTLGLLREQSGEIDYQTKVGGAVTDVYTDQARLSQDLLDIANRRRDELDQSLDLAKAERDVYAETRDIIQETRKEAELLGSALGTAARNAANAALNLNGNE